MSETVIKLENIGKQYRLGTVGSQTLRGDLQRWWYNMRGKDDPALKIGQINQLNQKSKITIDSDYVWALKDINLEVKQGEILGIIGKNGAGKSTLLKLLSRVTGPTTGQIKIKGRIASLLEVGTGFHPELTGRENIFLNGAILGMTKNDIRLKFDEIVEFAGVAKYVDTPVKRYSSGMYVRLAFAVAAHLEPDILVVDEVLAVGDGEFQKKAIGKMQDVSRGGGRTVLFVSHNMGSISQLCTTAILLKDGSIYSAGETFDIIEKYNSSFSGQTKTKFEKVYNDTYRLGVENVAAELIKKNNNLDLLIKICTKSDMPNNGVGIAIIVKTKGGIKLCRLGAAMTGFTFNNLSGERSISLISSNIDTHLSSGTYVIDIIFVIPFRENILKIEDQILFEIPEIDHYNHGFIQQSELHGPIPLSFSIKTEKK